MKPPPPPQAQLHTALPWAVVGGYCPDHTAINSPDGYIVWQMADRDTHEECGRPITAPDYETQRANARYIVTACNSMPAMRSALERALTDLELAHGGRETLTIRQVRQALAQSGGSKA